MFSGHEAVCLDRIDINKNFVHADNFWDDRCLRYGGPFLRFLSSLKVLHQKLQVLSFIRDYPSSCCNCKTINCFMTKKVPRNNGHSAFGACIPQYSRQNWQKSDGGSICFLRS